MGRLTRVMLVAWLALGCVSELEVGQSKPPPEVNEHGGPDAGPTDAGSACVPSDCEPVLDVPVIDCDGGGVVQFLCMRAETGQCTLVPGECSTPIPSGPCEAYECDGPLFAGPAREAACSDGSAPLCERDVVSGICSYQCPAQAACGTADGQGCRDEQYCLLRVGMCGTGESGGLCATRPPACDAIPAPVCGCDGQSYDNECEAARSGVNVVFAGPCSDVPELCDRCEGPPGVPVTDCGDGEHVSGPQCVRVPDGSCAYQWLSCPSPGVCNKLDGPEPGRCFGDAECEAGERCEGAVLCPCASECFAPDTPGFCK